MFVISATHLISREEMEPLLLDHARWLKIQHDAGIFLTSGCNLERTGGAMMAQGISREELNTLLSKSPLARAKAATYEIVEVSSFIDFLST